MRRVRSTSRPRQSASTAEVPSLAGDDGRATVAMIQALLPLGLRAVEEALQQEVRALAGPRRVWRRTLQAAYAQATYADAKRARDFTANSGC